MPRRVPQCLVDHPLGNSAGAGARHAVGHKPTSCRRTPIFVSTGWSRGWWLLRIAGPRRWLARGCRAMLGTGALAQSCVVRRPPGWVLQSVVRLVDQVQDCRRAAQVRVCLTKQTPVCRPELCRGGRWCDPENLVVGTDGSQRALPGRSGECELAGQRGITALVRLRRWRLSVTTFPPPATSEVFTTDRRASAPVASVEPDKAG